MDKDTYRRKVGRGDLCPMSQGSTLSDDPQWLRCKHPTPVQIFTHSGHGCWPCQCQSASLQRNIKRLSKPVDLKDALFDDLQALSDDAEALGLKDVSLVLEFAMDVYLRETQEVPRSQSTEQSPPAYLLAQVYRQAS